ncbi:hypothetical protein C2S52_009219 [Perilla frutescens var. hirtella]|nr:hypothetical protein C2S52_009219 [Perilla frutescens var. hirtella]
MSKVPFQLLELSLISAQDLALGSKDHSKNLKTYAVTWISPDRKLRTGTDQKGGNNPHWNQKFLFRVEDYQMDSESDSVMIEIYAVGWLKDTIIGSVSVLIRDLIPPSVRRERRVVALQVRRQSGRPQGILSMGVAVLDNTIKSMPLCTVLTGSTVGFQDICGGGKKGKGNGNQAIRLNRTMSDQTSLSRRPGEGKRKRNNSICNGSTLTGVGGGSVVNPGFDGGYGGGGGGGSMLNGSLCSDLGPSPSVVAIAISHGLYPLHEGPPPNPGSSVLEDWTVEAGSSVVEVQMKMEQWRLDRHQGYQKLGNGKKRQKKRNHRRRRTEEYGGDGDRRFSCFGNACGCEFTVVFGSGVNFGYNSIHNRYVTLNDP